MINDWFVNFIFDRRDNQFASEMTPVGKSG